MPQSRRVALVRAVRSERGLSVDRARHRARRARARARGRGACRRRRPGHRVGRRRHAQRGRGRARWDRRPRSVSCPPGPAMAWPARWACRAASRRAALDGLSTASIRADRRRLARRPSVLQHRRHRPRCAHRERCSTARGGSGAASGRTSSIGVREGWRYQALDYDRRSSTACAARDRAADRVRQRARVRAWARASPRARSWTTACSRRRSSRSRRVLARFVDARHLAMRNDRTARPACDRRSVRSAAVIEREGRLQYPRRRRAGRRQRPGRNPDSGGRAAG